MIESSSIFKNLKPYLSSESLQLVSNYCFADTDILTGIRTDFFESERGYKKLSELKDDKHLNIAYFQMETIAGIDEDCYKTFAERINSYVSNNIWQEGCYLLPFKTLATDKEGQYFLFLCPLVFTRLMR